MLYNTATINKAIRRKLTEVEGLKPPKIIGE